ncbi:caldesmon 1a isoform X2 [Entelurus aequoreus]|uniref:caldesmon 1a isoform X2 n=1 Tax=Entelurus aequoreus TaxID=161455 RepID=UPI002B1DC501|nr:caldesmon 1a isoform X2 [Entelurus aequoreus]XP_061920469.1 caldesmon 1a isoform X2 [Entelurus aequoreus]
MVNHSQRSLEAPPKTWRVVTEDREVITRGATMEEMDFDRRRELRRQKREEMRLEAERMSRNDDDEEEAARERRRRARQERLRSRELEESSGQPDSLVLTNSHSVTESDSVSSSYGGNDDTEEQALLDRMAKREERRQRRLKEALERQTQLDTETEGQRDYDVGGAEEKSKKQEVVEEGRSSSWRQGRYHHGEEEEKEVVVVTREEEDAAPDEERVMDEKPRRSYLREEELTGKGSHSVVSSNQAESADVVAEEAPEGDYVDATSGSERTVQRNDSEADREVCQILQSQDNQMNEASRSLEVREEQRKQNGGLHEEEDEEEEEEEGAIPKQHRNLERTLSRGSVRSPEASAADEQDEDDTAARLEAERKLEELKRRRDNAENEEIERRRQKQQEAEAELEELKRKREERRKVLEEEERQKKQEEADKKAKEEEEKRKMKEEIERRRAEAAEKRQKVEDPLDNEDKLFKCVSPRGSSLKIGERAEFLNKSAQKSTVKTSLTPVVSKIDNRLEQYTSAVLRENKESRSPRSGAVDLPVVADSIRNIKSMWEKGSVFSTSGSGGSSAFKEAAAIKSGVAGRINDWLNKTPESSKASAGRPSDLKPVDVSNKRSLWENKGSSTAKNS